MGLPDWITFASDATLYALCGGALLCLSAFAAWSDHRRKTRKDINRVPLLPWRDIGALSLFAGLILLAFAGMGWLSG